MDRRVTVRARATTTTCPSRAFAVDAAGGVTSARSSRTRRVTRALRRRAGRREKLDETRLLSRRNRSGVAVGHCTPRNARRVDACAVNCDTREATLGTRRYLRFAQKEPGKLSRILPNVSCLVEDPPNCCVIHASRQRFLHASSRGAPRSCNPEVTRRFSQVSFTFTFTSWQRNFRGGVDEPALF